MPRRSSIHTTFSVAMQPFMQKYKVEVVAVGEGRMSTHTGMSCPISAVLKFPDKHGVDSFSSNPAYQEIKVVDAARIEAGRQGTQVCWKQSER